jgi:cysteine desulfurase
VVREVYLDNNATTYLAPEVQDAICVAVRECFGNPSSAHRSGERARRAVSIARSAVADLLRVSSESIVFGSGVTELNNWVISNAIKYANVDHIVLSEVEHASVNEAALVAESQGVLVTRIPVGQCGLVDLDAIKNVLKSAKTLVSVQWVNNETGVVQPISEIAQMCSTAGALFHCDAAQAVGKMAVDLSEVTIDFVTVSAHKMHGPAGIGAMVVRNRRGLSPFMFGGSQELGLRPGTENVLGIIGFGAAASIRKTNLLQAIDRMRTYRDAFESEICASIPVAQINGAIDRRVCNTTNILFPGVDGAALVANLDRQGVRCSQISACSNRQPEPSHVLLAMGLTEHDANSSVRFSFSDQNCQADVAWALSQVVSAFNRLADRNVDTRSFEAQGVISHEV